MKQIGDLLILGAGGQGKVVLECALYTKLFNNISFLDDNRVGQEVLGHLVIGKIEEYTKLRKNYEYAFVAIGDNTLRLKLIDALLKEGYKVPILIHSNAIVSSYCQIGQGTIILAGAIVNTRSEIGKGVIVNTASIVEHDCKVADGVHLSPGSRMGGGVVIGERTWVCIGATIIDHIHIGSDCMIAAGAVVVNDISDRARVYGIPATTKNPILPRKILILANYDLGLYKFRRELIQALLDRGNQVYIALPEGEWIAPLINIGCQFAKVAVDRRGMNPIKDIKLLLTYKRLLKKIQPDQVITYTIKPNIYGGLVCKWSNIAYFTNITGLGSAFQKKGLFKRLITRLYKAALKKAKYVFFENEENRKIFVQQRIINENRGILLNGAGINLTEYPWTPIEEVEDRIRFLFIGRVMKEKGVDELFEVARSIRGIYHNVEFDIVGPLEEDYQTVIDQLVRDRIINYYGYQEDVRPYIMKATCLILPSYHEGMANTLLEAAAMGRPLITSNIAGCREAVNGNGYLVEVGDKQDLHKKVEWFIHLSYKERVQMGQQSRAYIEENFDKRKVVEKTLGYICKS